MSEKNTMKILLIVLAIIGTIALVAILGMWLMMGGMMSGGRMMNCCGGGMMWGWFVGFLVIAGLIAAVAWLVRRNH